MLLLGTLVGWLMLPSLGLLGAAIAAAMASRQPIRRKSNADPPEPRRAHPPTRSGAHAVSRKGPRARLRKPGRIQHRSGHLPINVRTHFSAPPTAERFKFVFAVVSASLWEKPILQHIGEQLGVGPIGQAQKIVETLLRQAVDAGVFLQSLLHRGILFVILHELIGRVDSASDQSARRILAKLQRIRRI